MIAASVVWAIQELLNEGKLSQRKIARRLGVSRGTVSGIARGKRRRPPMLPGPPKEWFFDSSAQPIRCPGCGGMVRMPCLLCHVRYIT